MLPLSTKSFENLFSFSFLNPETVIVWAQRVQGMKKLMSAGSAVALSAMLVLGKLLKCSFCKTSASLIQCRDVCFEGIYRIVGRCLWMSSLVINTNVPLYLDNVLLLNSFNRVFPCRLFSNADKENNNKENMALFLSVHVWKSLLVFADILRLRCFQLSLWLFGEFAY